MIYFKAEGRSERGVTLRHKLLKDNPEESLCPLTPRRAREIFWVQETSHHFLPYSFRHQALIPKGYTLKHRLRSLFQTYFGFYNTMKIRIQLKAFSCEHPYLFRRKMGFKY